MQPELPWNIAGIAPEAREAARASARREGLSVGEWLTRRILKSLGESEQPRDDLWAASPPKRSHGESTAPPPESVDMLAHVSRSESETQSSGRRIEDQLKNLARRLEYTERSQSENSRAMTQAASEINIVSREQAQAFDQLGAHVVRLDDRLAHIEQLSAADGTKEAIKALHLGLSRLADQMAQTATRSAAQASELAENMGAVVGKLAESRDEGRQNWHALEERVAALAANVGSVAGRLLESRDLAERAFRAMDARLSTAEDALARLDATHTGRSEDDAEMRRQAVALAALSDSVETLGQRLDAVGTDTSQHLEQFGARLDQSEARAADSTTEARLDAAEQRFDAEMRSLAARVELATQDQSNAVAELGTAVKELSRRVDAARVPPPAAAAEQNGTARFGLPPFGDTAPKPAEPVSDANPRPVAAGLEAFFGSRHGGSAQSAGAKAFSWTDPPKAENRTIWIILLAALAGLVIAAAVAGTILSRTQETTVPPHAPPVRNETHSGSPVTTNYPPAPRAANPSSASAPRPANSSNAAPASAANMVPQPHAIRAVQIAPATPHLRAPDLHTATLPAATKSASASPQDRLAALARDGNAKAETLLGIQYVDGQGRPINEAEGAKWLERAALKGDAVAAWRLGSMYEHGQGIPADAAKSVQWYTLAAKAGNRKAMHNLAVAYANGSGVTKDLGKAAQWFARAAALGLADSQYNLAVLYERGLGLPQNVKAAYTWYAIAAAQGDAGSKTRLAALASQIGADDKAAAEKAAADFRPDALDAAANSPPDLADIAGG